MEWTKRNVWVMVIAAAITIVGLLTGWYLFVFVMLPLGFVFKKNNRKDDK